MALTREATKGHMTTPGAETTGTVAGTTIATVTVRGTMTEIVTVTGVGMGGVVKGVGTVVGGGEVGTEVSCSLCV